MDLVQLKHAEVTFGDLRRACEDAADAMETADGEVVCLDDLHQVFSRIQETGGHTAAPFAVMKVCAALAFRA